MKPTPSVDPGVAPFQLPAAPVDRYEVRYFRVERGTVVPVRAVYYANLRWPEYRSQGGRGADLVDDWMLYENDAADARARLTGWASVLRGDWRYCFPTAELAASEAFRQLTDLRRGAAQQVRELQEQLLDLHRQAEGHWLSAPATELLLLLPDRPGRPGEARPVALNETWQEVNARGYTMPHPDPGVLQPLRSPAGTDYLRARGLR